MTMLALSDLDAEDLTSIAHGHLDDITRALKGLSDVAEHLADRDSLAALVYELHATFVGWPTKGAPAMARLVLDEFKAALLAEAGERSFDVPAIGRLEIRQSKKRTGWNWDSLIPAVVKAGQTERRIIDPDAGEVESEGHAVARALRECVSFSGGKVTGLRARNLDVDEFCVTEDAGWDVVLPAPSEAR